MKKLFTLIVAFLATTTIMAQMPSEMKFVGESSYTATIMGITAGGGCEHDTIAVSNIDAANGCSDIAIPAMNVEIPNLFSKTIPAMTLTAVPFTMTMAGGMTINWAAESLSYTVMDGDDEKNVTITNLTGTYSSASKQMSLKFDMTYGNMPGVVSFEENNAVYQTTGISEISANETNGKARKMVVNGKVIIEKEGKLFDTAGALLK